MPRRKDIWKCGIVAQPIATILTAGGITGPVTWLSEEPNFQFLADPFGWRGEDGRLHVFAEHYDYRIRHGTIETLVLDEDGHLLERRPCLVEPWHLSYPQVFAGEGALWMLPEAHRSGGLTLYRDHGGLVDWRAECRIMLDCVPVDASILRHDGRWWLFYSPATSKMTKLSHLHIAWAERLCGPWTVHPGNPVRIDPRSARPGGAPVAINGRIMVPVQDCATTYGGAIRPLWIDRLDETAFVGEAGDALTIPASADAYRDGMHSLTACGDVTLFDVKRIDRSLRGLMLDVRRGLGGYG
ncbi:formyl transferase [Sphingobium estronivorans]|uniref:glucosamine inositolphosphorylceramide transferase family protein n=1 Tax=Sphingobium estronivorans TaxID=1577690 RepID=UPI00196839C9|nr:formyl transferase [Sphingobium estronivorans]